MNIKSTPIKEVLPGSSVRYGGKTWLAAIRTRKTGRLAIYNKLLINRFCESRLIDDEYVDVVLDHKGNPIINEA